MTFCTPVVFPDRIQSIKDTTHVRSSMGGYVILNRSLETAQPVDLGHQITDIAIGYGATVSKSLTHDINSGLGIALSGSVSV